MASQPIIILNTPGSVSNDSIKSAIIKINANLQAIDSLIDLKANASAVPTKISALSNDIGFLTQSQVRTSISVTGGGLAYNAVTGVISYAAPSVPTALSGLSNDLGFITQSGARAALSVSGPGITYNATTGVISVSVASVSGRTGHVTLAKSDVGLANVDNTSDATKVGAGNPIGDALAAKAALTGASFTGDLVTSKNATVLGTAYVGSSAQGFLALNGGGTSGNTGLVEFYPPASQGAARRGYIGYATASGAITIAAETSGGYVNFQAQSGALGPKVNGNEIWHAGNFNPSSRLQQGDAAIFSSIAVSVAGSALLTLKDTTVDPTRYGTKIIGSSSGVDGGDAFLFRKTRASDGAAIDYELNGPAGRFWHSGNLNPATKASIGADVSFAALQATGLSVANAGDSILTLHDSSAANTRYRIKQVYASKNVSNGDAFLFRQIRPSDNAVQDYTLSGPSGDILTSTNLGVAYASGLVMLGSRADITAQRISLATNAIQVAGYARPGDGGGAQYQRASASAHGAIQDAAGNWWGLSRPHEVPVDAFGATIDSSDCTAALQRAANTGVINLLARDYVYSGTVFTGNPNNGVTNPAKYGINIRGAGESLTRLLFTGTGDGFQHGFGWDDAPSNNNPPPDSPFMMSDLTMIAAAGNSQSTAVYTSGENTGAHVNFVKSHYAIAVRQNGNWGQFVLRNIRFRAFDGRSAWESHVYGEGITYTNFYHVRCDGGSYATTPIELNRNTQVAIEIRCKDLSSVPDNQRAKYKAFVFNFDNCDFSAVTHGIRFGCAGNGSTLEGAQFHKCGGRTVKGPWCRLEVNNPGWYPPYFAFSHCNTEGPGQLMNLDAVSELHISHCLIYLSPNAYGLSGQDFISIGRVRQAYIEHNSFIFYNGSRVNSVIAIGAGSRNVNVVYNTFEFDNNGAGDYVANNFLWSASGNTGMRAHYNNFVRHPSGTPSNTNNTSGPWQVL